MLEDTNNEKEEKENIEQKKLIEEVYTEKCNRLLLITCGVLILSFITYIYYFEIYKLKDFGIFFELTSFIFILFSMIRAKSHLIDKAKKYIIIAMIPIGWLIIYDFLDLIINFKLILKELYYLNLNNSFGMGIYYLNLFDATLIITIILLYRSLISLNRAEGNEKYKTSIDWFYHKK